MKLILCRKCQDVFKLQLEPRTCLCGATWGKYGEDELHAQYSGEFAVPIGFSNDSFAFAVRHQPAVGMGLDFLAFVIPKQCTTLEVLDAAPSE